MVDACRTVVGDVGAVSPPSLDRKAPGWTIPLRNNVTSLLDCDGAGVTITQSTWTVHTDDDDGSVTFSGQTISGLTTRTLVVGGVDGAVYRIQNSITASDGAVFVLTVSVPVLETRALNS